MPYSAIWNLIPDGAKPFLSIDNYILKHICFYRIVLKLVNFWEVCFLLLPLTYQIGEEVSLGFNDYIYICTYVLNGPWLLVSFRLPNEIKIRYRINY